RGFRGDIRWRQRRRLCLGKILLRRLQRCISGRPAKRSNSSVGIGVLGIMFGNAPRVKSRSEIIFARHANSTASGSSALLQDFFHALDVRWHVNADRVVIRFHTANAKTIFKPPKLLKLFKNFALPCTKRRKLEYRLATKRL